VVSATGVRQDAQGARATDLPRTGVHPVVLIPIMTHPPVRAVSRPGDRMIAYGPRKRYASQSQAGAQRRPDLPGGSQQPQQHG